jgi:hypothetical protein
MKPIALVWLTLYCLQSIAQNEKGRVFGICGWNRALYSQSDIEFHGNGYSFVLEDVRASDRQSRVDAEHYVRPSNVSIPQTNFRIGYFFKDNWSISFGVDHMKYVMNQGQTVKIHGGIENSGTMYDGSYDNVDIVLSPDFLTYEHTNGLNYINLELVRHWHIFHYKPFQLNVNPFTGISSGLLYPKTASKLLNHELADEFHAAGFGLAAKLGLEIILLKYLSLQTELKGGWIDLNDVRTTSSSVDRAKQNFFFTQWNFMFGLNVPILNRKSINPIHQD